MSQIDNRTDRATKTSRTDDNVVDLLGRLTSQSAHLAQQQVNLVQAEMRESVADIQKSVASLLGAAVFGIAGLSVTLMGIAYLIGDAIDDRDLATLLVGLATLILAAILYRVARSKMKANNLKPERTIDTVERTPDAATGDLTHSGAKR
ncbi:phage holin family protein [Aurantiacibacter poecillastricola]|uniref:phage holin family protein n=1 Tax=Aurantiacibacter poecillastricola TaxID=3064385 RepID=UPI00273F6A58|nr:phage holin family protein [Aurantiacibacter sp. 219JJ12-13]MDP5260968.1 phage holin family protein [Aurantiacibacter sp. 219JJ12-13]